MDISKEDFCKKDSLLPEAKGGIILIDSSIRL